MLAINLSHVSTSAHNILSILFCFYVSVLRLSYRELWQGSIEHDRFHLDGIEEEITLSITTRGATELLCWEMDLWLSNQSKRGS